MPKTKSKLSYKKRLYKTRKHKTKRGGTLPLPEPESNILAEAKAAAKEIAASRKAYQAAHNKRIMNAYRRRKEKENIAAYQADEKKRKENPLYLGAPIPSFGLNNGLTVSKRMDLRAERRRQERAALPSILTIRPRNN